MRLCFQVPARWKHGEAGRPPWEGVPVLWGGRVWPHRVRVSPEHAEGWQPHPSGRPSPSCLTLWAFLQRGQHVYRCSRWVGRVWIFSLFFIYKLPKDVRIKRVFSKHSAGSVCAQLSDHLPHRQHPPYGGVGPGIAVSGSAHLQRLRLHGVQAASDDQEGLLHGAWKLN